jgi:transcription initiation factor TFIIH subunit 3
VKIDVCKVYGEDTVFLQQAAHLTGGSYVSPPRRDALLQYLVVRPIQVAAMQCIPSFGTTAILDVLPRTWGRPQYPCIANSRAS